MGRRRVNVRPKDCAGSRALVRITLPWRHAVCLYDVHCTVGLWIHIDETSVLTKLGETPQSRIRGCRIRLFVRRLSSRMAARLPPLSHARDAEFWRQRIIKEQRAGGMSEPASAFASPRLTPRPIPMASPTPVFRQPFARPMTTNPAELMGASTWRPTPTLLMPARSPDLQRALQRGWTEPPLIMSKGFVEPPRVFRKYLEASTSSVHKPPVPVLHWR